MTSGADAVVADGPDLTKRIQAAVGGAPIRLAFDAVAGEVLPPWAAAWWTAGLS